MKTLYESIPDTVAKAPTDLGENIKQLDWANAAVAERNRIYNS